MEAPAGTGPGCRAGLGAIADVRPVRGGEPDPGAVLVVEPTDERGGVIGPPSRRIGSPVDGSRAGSGAGELAGRGALLCQLTPSGGQFLSCWCIEEASAPDGPGAGAQDRHPPAEGQNAPTIRP